MLSMQTEIPKENAQELQELNTEIQTLEQRPLKKARTKNNNSDWPNEESDGEVEKSQMRSKTLRQKRAMVLD